jgi:predicted MFS family arabinose efflux permease
MRFIVWGVMPIGAVLGGLLGDYLGLRETLLVTSAGAMLAVLWPLCSDVRTLREQPAAAESSIATAAAPAD